jgi:hypothetical protein
MKKVILIAATGFSLLQVNAQVQTSEDVAGRTGRRYIQSAVPFLMISPDSRAGGMADVGVATSADVNSLHWNAAKLPYIKDADGNLSDMGVGISVTPWLRKLIDDMSMNNLSGYYRISKQEVIGASLDYFNLGKMTFREGPGEAGITGEKKPYELNFGLAYARQLSEPLSVSLGLKFIHSNLASGAVLSNGETAKAGNAVAADLGVYYNKNVTVSGEQFHLALGANISNIGNKLTYTTREQAYFIPTNLRIGTAITKEIDMYNKITLAIDINKLMVPTPAIYYVKANGSDSTDVDGNKLIYKGKDASNKGLIAGMFGSFADAPGGFKEEMQEYILQGALEYWYLNAFAARAGFYHEAETKGNRKYATLGLGVRYKLFGADFAYLIPIRQNNPLRDTIRISLLVNFASKKPQGTPDITE